MPSGFTPRSDWSDVPPALAASIERAIGASIVGTEGVHGGMSSGPAAILSLADGRQVFAKAVAAERNSKAHALYARELDVLRLLPADVPHAPLVAGVGHGDWLCVMTEAGYGLAMGPPWRSQDLAAVAEAVAATSSHTDVPGVAAAADRLPSLDGWEALAKQPELLDEWERQRLDTLLAMASGWRTWTTGRHLVHLDVRCDNVVPGAGTAWLVDWAHAASGAWWIDHAGLAVDVVASGHIGGEWVALSAARGILAGLPYEATRFVIAMAGMFRRNALREAPPAVPGLRAWQAERARALRPLVERLVSR